MTVMLGFTNERKKASFLGADDLEPMSGRREEKTMFLFRRFLVGGVGNNVVFKAATVLSVFENQDTIFSDGTMYSYPKSISDLCNDVAKVLPIVALNTYRALEDIVKKGKYTKKQAESLERQANRLCVIDTREFRVVYVSFDLVYPPKSNYGFEITTLPANRLIRFGIDNPKDLGLITDDLCQPSFAWCAHRIEEATQEVENAGYVGLIGKLGACYLVREGKVTRRTTYSSLEGTALHWYPSEHTT